MCQYLIFDISGDQHVACRVGGRGVTGILMTKTTSTYQGYPQMRRTHHDNNIAQLI